MFPSDFKPAPGQFRPGAIGHGRCRITSNYAVMPPEGVMDSYLPQWVNTVARFLAGPQLGAKFGQVILEMAADGGTRGRVADGLQHLFWVLEGTVTLAVDDHEPVELTPGGYAYLPAGTGHTVTAAGGSPARLMDIRKPYVPAEGFDAPPVIISHRDALEKVNHNGTVGRTWEHLMPYGDMRFDFEVNILSFEPGVHFPDIETHIMEHGLLMLEGQGLYLLGQDWHEVWQDDFIWMGPFCPQFFYPTGWTRSAYMLYKDVNRDLDFGHA